MFSFQREREPENKDKSIRNVYSVHCKDQLEGSFFAQIIVICCEPHRNSSGSDRIAARTKDFLLSPQFECKL